MWGGDLRCLSGSEQSRIVVTAAPSLTHMPSLAAYPPPRSPPKPFPGETSSVCALGHDFTIISTALLPRKPLPYEFLFYGFAKANMLSQQTGGIPLGADLPSSLSSAPLPPPLFPAKGKAQEMPTSNTSNFSDVRGFSVLLLTTGR